LKKTLKVVLVALAVCLLFLGGILSLGGCEDAGRAARNAADSAVQGGKDFVDGWNNP